MALESYFWSEEEFKEGDIYSTFAKIYYDILAIEKEIDICK